MAATEGNDNRLIGSNFDPSIEDPKIVTSCISTINKPLRIFEFCSVILLFGFVIYTVAVSPSPLPDVASILLITLSGIYVFVIAVELINQFATGDGILRDTPMLLFALLGSVLFGVAGALIIIYFYTEGSLWTILASIALCMLLSLIFLIDAMVVLSFWRRRCAVCRKYCNYGNARIVRAEQSRRLMIESEKCKTLPSVVLPLEINQANPQGTYYDNSIALEKPNQEILVTANNGNQPDGKVVTNFGSWRSPNGQAYLSGMSTDIGKTKDVSTSPTDTNPHRTMQCSICPAFVELVRQGLTKPNGPNYVPGQSNYWHCTEALIKVRGFEHLHEKNRTAHARSGEYGMARMSTISSITAYKEEDAHSDNLLETVIDVENKRNGKRINASTVDERITVNQTEEKSHQSSINENNEFTFNGWSTLVNSSNGNDTTKKISESRYSEDRKSQLNRKSNDVIRESPRISKKAASKPNTPTKKSGKVKSQQAKNSPRGKGDNNTWAENTRSKDVTKKIQSPPSPRKKGKEKISASNDTANNSKSMGKQSAGSEKMKGKKAQLEQKLIKDKDAVQSSFTAESSQSSEPIGKSNGSPKSQKKEKVKSRVLARANKIDPVDDQRKNSGSLRAEREKKTKVQEVDRTRKTETVVIKKPNYGKMINSSPRTSHLQRSNQQTSPRKAFKYSKNILASVHGGLFCDVCAPPCSTQLARVVNSSHVEGRLKCATCGNSLRVITVRNIGPTASDIPTGTQVCPRCNRFQVYLRQYQESCPRWEMKK